MGVTEMSDTKIDIWMPVYIGDFHKDTTDFTTEMVGAYILLCLQHWYKGPFKDDEETLARITKLSADRFRSDPPPLSWSTLIVSKGGPNNGCQETSSGRDRYKIAPG